jgi:hypothetical protein
MPLPIPEDLFWKMDWPLNLFQPAVGNCWIIHGEKVVETGDQRCPRSSIPRTVTWCLPGLYVVEGPALLALRELYNTEEIPVGIL